MTLDIVALEADGGGAHPAAASGAPLRDVVAAVEAAGATLVTFADGPIGAAPRVEAGTRAAFLAPLTERIGLAPTLHVTLTEPFHLATQLASLDHASHGRAAWVVGAAHDAASLATVGRAPLAPAEVHQEVRDVISVARALWDSWEDGATIRDIASGRFLDPDRVHHVDFVGDTFTVKGPLITPRPPQGQVVVLAPAELEVDDLADVVLVGKHDLEARSRRARSAGALVLADVEVLLDAEAPAADRLAELDAVAPWAPTGALRHVGSADGLVDLLDRLSGLVDGVRLIPAVLAVDLPVLARHVRVRAPGATLRESLGLPRPTNRFATA